VIDDGVRANMRRVLAEVRDGTFAREWIADMDDGEAGLHGLRAEAETDRLETVGRDLRGRMRRAEAREADPVA
jgi:ketol-acid reductoisomerase